MNNFRGRCTKRWRWEWPAFLHGALGGMMDVAFWYRFAICLKRCLFLTAVDVGTHMRFSCSRNPALKRSSAACKADRFTPC
ncbi:hypothetical protein ACNKHP_20680 [Shigella boydii]